MPESKRQNRLFCFGYGYSCEYLARTLKSDGGWEIAGTTRDPEKKKSMRTAGVETYMFSGDASLVDARQFLEGTTHLLISTPPDDQGDPAFRHHADDVLGIDGLRWVGYLSSTSVYGDRDGGWVDEESELRPNSKRGSRRAKAEDQWLTLWKDEGLPVHIFRLAGIYGPSRSALDAVRAGVSRRIDKPGHAFSRVHIDDIVQVLLASMSQPNPGRVYNVCDDEAAPSHKLIALACEMLGMSVPALIPYEQADLAPMTRSFYSDNKRVKNERIKKELGITLRHPDFRSGLEACLAQEAAAPAGAYSDEV
jgi:nucleoside-diphosphate-sugar epimerase